MDQNIHQNLIATIRSYIPEDKNIGEFLADILRIGKVSVYRRIRGEVPFTLDEVARISSELDFSLDRIIGVKKPKKAIFDLHLLNQSEPSDIYSEALLNYADTLQKMMTSDNFHLRVAINTTSYIFLQNRVELSKFRFYKWLYQTQKIRPNFLLSEFDLSGKIISAQKKLSNIAQNIPFLTVVVSQQVFMPTIHDINYFFKRNLITEKELEQLKKELLEVVDYIEELTINGETPKGGKVEIFLSSVDLESSYLHAECVDRAYCLLRVYSVNALESVNDRICDLHKEWIESLKKFSILISRSGEIQRFEFLNKQRQYIREMGNNLIE